MWWHTPEPGDWVKADKEVRASIGDFLTGSGISRGTRGVVIERQGGRVLVEFDHRLGAARASVQYRDLKLVRRGGGIDHFRARARRMSIIRLALAGFLLFPIAQFVVVYIWHNHTITGLVPAFAEGMLWSTGDWLGLLLEHPLQTLIYCGFLAILAKIAFRH